MNSVGAQLGGAVGYLQALLPRLGEVEGFRFVVLVDSETASRSRFPSGERVEVRPVRFRGRIHRVLWDQFRLPRIVRRLNGQILLSLLNHGPRFPSVPQVILQRNSWYFAPQRPERRSLPGAEFLAFRRWSALQACKGAELVLVPSAATKHALARWLHRDGKIVVLPHGIDTQFWKPDPGNLEDLPAGLDRSAGPRIVYVAHAAPYKGHDDLLRAIRSLAPSLPDAQVALTLGDEGAGHAQAHVVNALRESARDLPMVSFVGIQRDSKAVRALYEWCDIAVLPSHMESFGFPMLEAFAMAKPVVASDLKPLRELGGEVAVYHRVGDADGLARALLSLGRDEQQRRTLGEAGRKRAELFDWDVYVPRLIELLRAALAGAQPIDKAR